MTDTKSSLLNNSVRRTCIGQARDLPFLVLQEAQLLKAKRVVDALAFNRA